MIASLVCNVSCKIMVILFFFACNTSFVIINNYSNKNNDIILACNLSFVIINNYSYKKKIC